MSVSKHTAWPVVLYNNGQGIFAASSYPLTTPARHWFDLKVVVAQKPQSIIAAYYTYVRYLYHIRPYKFWAMCMKTVCLRCVYPQLRKLGRKVSEPLEVVPI